MFGGNPIVPLYKFLSQKPRYLGDNKGLLSLEGLQNMYRPAGHNLKLALSQEDKSLYTEQNLLLKKEIM